jgi:hypothetical protein
MSLMFYDQLRIISAAYGSKPYWFGLGFIQLKLSDSTRIHFWSPEIKRVEREEIHDHRYNFKSTVLYGTLHFDLFEMTLMQRDGVWTHELYQTDCSPEQEGNLEPKVYPVTLTKRGSYDLVRGSSYWFSSEQFHTTEGTELAVTYLERETKTKQFANVIKAKGAPHSCPFAEKMDEKLCWEHIKNICVMREFNGTLL